MTGSAECPRDHSRLPYRFLLGVKVLCGTCGEVVSGSGWRCGSCGWTLLDRMAPAWGRHVSTLGHRLGAGRREQEEMRPSSRYWEEVRKGAEQGRQKQEATERMVAEFRASAEAERRAVEEQDLRAREAAAAREALKDDWAAKAAETRKQQEEELLERTEAERRRTETDAALLAGKDPDLIPHSVRGATVAQVRARQVELARLKENRGKPWAELALDREILRLVRVGVDRPTIVKQLGVGAHRIARVRRDAGLESRRFQRTVSEPEPQQISRSLPDPDDRSEPPSEHDRPRRPAPE